MCRKNRVLGWCLLSAGLGALVTLLLGSGAPAVILALCLICAGVCLSGRR